MAPLLLAVLAPLVAALALLVKATSRGPVFYRQLRVGRDGREFEMLKFRSMRQAVAAEASFPCWGWMEAREGSRARIAAPGSGA